MSNDLLEFSRHWMMEGREGKRGAYGDFRRLLGC